MLTTETYSRAFWNSMRSKNTDGSVLKEGANLANGSYFLPEASAEKYAAALAKENLFRRMATFVRATTSGGKIITSDTPVDADWVGEGGAVPEAELTATRIALGEHNLACISVLDSDFVHPRVSISRTICPSISPVSSRKRRRTRFSTEMVLESPRASCTPQRARILVQQQLRQQISPLTKFTRCTSLSNRNTAPMRYGS